MNLAQAYDTNCITSIKLSPSGQNAGLEKKNLNCSVSYGQAAVTFCLPGATSCSSKELILLEDDLPVPFPFSK